MLKPAFKADNAIAQVFDFNYIYMDLPGLERMDNDYP
jgi:hypothetical protein